MSPPFEGPENTAHAGDAGQRLIEPSRPNHEPARKGHTSSRPVHIWHGAHDRMVPFAHATWLAGHIGGACPHLLDDHGHLTLLVDTLPQILVELIASNG